MSSDQLYDPRAGAHATTVKLGTHAQSQNCQSRGAAAHPNMPGSFLIIRLQCPGWGGGICISDVANCLSLPCALLCRPGSLTDMHTITYYTVSTEAPTRGPGFQRARGSHTQTMSRCKVPHAENQNRRGTRVVMWPGWVRGNLSEEVTFKMSPE